MISLQLMAEESAGAPDQGSVGFDPERDTVLDPKSLRGLAHPMRVRLRTELAASGPATASQLAARIGESSGATSYHLRQLATYGFVVEDQALGKGRERYWRAVHRSVWFGGVMPDTEPELSASAEYVRAVARQYADRIERFADGLEAATVTLGPEWDRAWDMSDWLLDLTPEQARDLSRQFHKLCMPFWHQLETPSADGTRRVVAQFQILPLPASD
jgi:DNA-binding transcriptional ArsR family regulator